MPVVRRRSRARAAAAEDLPAVSRKPPSTFSSLPEPVEPVGAARRREHQLLGGHAPEHRLGRLVPRAPDVRQRGDQVRVHRERERRRAAVVRELADHLAELGVRRAAAAQLARNARRERAVLLSASRSSPRRTSPPRRARRRAPRSPRPTAASIDPVARHVHVASPSECDGDTSTAERGYGRVLRLQLDRKHVYHLAR